MEDLLLLLKETGFILKMLLDHVALSKGQKYATVLESAVQEFSLPVLIFFFFFFCQLLTIITMTKEQLIVGLTTWPLLNN